MSRLSPPAPLVVVVEDDEDVRSVHAHYLAAHGFRVETAADGKTALRLITETRPDIVVMDLSLPALNGWEATRRLKHDLRTAHIPIIAYSGHAQGWSVEHALDAGCDAYVVKPCSPEDLLAEIQRVLARSVKPAPSKASLPSTRAV
jgi:two-component system, cell cycle response regulator DivK